MSEQMVHAELQERLRIANRREGLTYALALAFVLLIVAFGVLLWVMASGSESIDLGAASDIRPDMPVVRDVVLRDETKLKVWVVYTQGKWYVFDARTPRMERFSSWGCFFQWQPVTGRFEDPCSGAKFSLTGEFLDPYGYFSNTTVQNLNLYSITLRDDHLFIDPSRVIHAQPFVAPTP